MNNESVYLLREGNLSQTPVICDEKNMLQTLCESIENCKDGDGAPCMVVNQLGLTLRWRMLTKEQVRLLAQQAYQRFDLDKAGLDLITKAFS